MNPATFDAPLASGFLKEYDLSVSASLGLNDSTDLTSDDPAVVSAGEALLTDCLHILHTRGGTRLCGVIYSAMKKYMEPVSAAGRTGSAVAIGRLSVLAADLGIPPALSKRRLANGRSRASPALRTDLNPRAPCAQ